MNNALYALMNANAAVRKAVAILLLLGVLAVPLGLVAFVLCDVADLSNDIEARRLALGHVTDFIAGAAKARASAPVVADNAHSELFLAGATPSIAQANLQTLVTDLARKKGAEVISASGLPLLNEGALHQTGIKLSLQGDLSAVHAAIHDIEAASPALVIREASLRNMTPVQSNQLTGPIQLTADLSIYASISPAIQIDGDAK